MRNIIRIRLITTPGGIGNKAHDLWLKNYSGQCHVASMNPH